jgi:hypothetical protein
VQEKLVNTILTARLIDRTSIDEVVKKVRTASVSLAEKLGNAVAKSQSILTRVNYALEQSTASISAGEETIREQQKCIKEIDIAISGSQRLTEMARNGTNQQVPSYQEATSMVRRAKQEYDYCWFFCSGDRETLERARLVAEQAADRIHHYSELAEEFQKQKETINDHAANQRVRLTTLENTVIQLKETQMTISNITSELKQIMPHLSGLNAASGSLETVTKELVELDKLITPLNNIYNEMLKNQVMQPFVSGIITRETIDHFKISVNELAEKLRAIDVYALDRESDAESNTDDYQTSNDDEANNSDHRSSHGDDSNSDDTRVEAGNVLNKRLRKSAVSGTR